MSPKSEFADNATVGIDDTDVPGLGGTGRLARLLAEEIEATGRGNARGVTRHQLYEGPGVPKTARNSAAAVSFAATAPDLFEAAARIVVRESIAGSDPGVAVLTGAARPEALAFARQAQRGLVTQSEARRVAESGGVSMVGLGGTDDGVIGALSAAALRADGNDGRFVGLPGIREVTGEVSVDELMTRTGISAVLDVDHEEPLEGGVRLDVGQWVRPRLVGGRPVLVARREEGRWVNADARPQ